MAVRDLINTIHSTPVPYYSTSTRTWYGVSFCCLIPRASEPTSSTNPLRVALSALRLPVLKYYAYQLVVPGADTCCLVAPQRALTCTVLLVVLKYSSTQVLEYALLVRVHVLRVRLPVCLSVCLSVSAVVRGQGYKFYDKLYLHQPGDRPL